MKRGKNAEKKSISFPAEMAEWLVAEEAKTGVPISKTVQKAVQAYRKKRLRQGTGEEGSASDGEQFSKMVKDVSLIAPAPEPELWSLRIMEARDYHAAFRKKDEEAETYQARSERAQDAHKRKEMLALAGYAREQAKILRDAFMHALEEARKEDHHKEALKKEESELAAHNAAPKDKNDFGFSGSPSTIFTDLEKAYKEARKASKKPRPKIEGKGSLQDSLSLIPHASGATPSEDNLRPKKNGTK